MNSEQERLDRNEQRNSLAALLRTLKFRKPRPKGPSNEQPMARLQSRIPQPGAINDDYNCVRSAN